METPKYLEEYIPDNIKLNNVSEFIYQVEDISDDSGAHTNSFPQKFLIISGMSGAGKTSICEKVMDIDDSYIKVKTSTTRPRRAEEDSDTDPYFRYTIEEFRDSLQKGEILEYSEYAEHFYFTRNDSISSILREGKNPMVVMDPKGSNFYKNLWNLGDSISRNVTLTRFFVVPPSMEAMQERLFSRSHDQELADKRISQSLIDITHISETDFVVVNETDRLTDVVHEILKIIR